MVKIRWFGHSAFLVNIRGRKFLIDPWIENPLSPVKVSEVISEPDFIIVTHDHGDHLGNATDIMKGNNRVKLIAVFEIANHVAEQLGDSSRVIDANIGGPIDLGNGFFAVLTHALHSSLHGHPTGVIVGAGDEVVYHAGDTGLTYDMKLIGELYKPLVALLPIGGHYTMGPREAAKAVELINPKYAIPMHYATFPVIKGRPEDFVKHVNELSLKAKVIVLKPGEEVELR